MGSIFNPKFWLQIFISTFFTMCIIFVIKRVSNAFNIPVVKTIANET